MSSQPIDDDLDPTARVSAMWWSEDETVMSVVSHALSSRALTRGSWQAVKVQSVSIVEDDAVARQSAFEAFLRGVAHTLSSLQVPGRPSGILGVGELRVHLALSGPELARGVVFDPESLAQLLPFGLSIYID